MWAKKVGRDFLVRCNQEDRVSQKMWLLSTCTFGCNGQLVAMAATTTFRQCKHWIQLRETCCMDHRMPHVSRHVWSITVSRSHLVSQSVVAQKSPPAARTSKSFTCMLLIQESSFCGISNTFEETFVLDVHTEICMW